MLPAVEAFHLLTHLIQNPHGVSIVIIAPCSLIRKQGHTELNNIPRGHRVLGCALLEKAWHSLSPYIWPRDVNVNKRTD